MRSRRLNTHQMLIWGGDFGKAYTDRNIFSPEELDAHYCRTYGAFRTELNWRFLAGIEPGARILEVGCNVGNQLLCLERAGFRNLYGVELQEYAVEFSRQRSDRITVLLGSAFDIPFQDDDFDMVFTSGLLTHIHPSNLAEAMEEVHRCSREYIWGFEAYEADLAEIYYRGQKSLMWKADYSRQYLKSFLELEVVREEHLSYLHSGNKDSMFLLRKIKKGGK